VLFPIREGESVVIRFTPARSTTSDYVVGETQEPH